MENLRDIDLMARGGTLALLALWSFLLIRDHRSALPARFAVLMNAAIACHILADTNALQYDGTVLLLFFRLGQSAAPGCFWLFARVWFNDERKVGWPSFSLIFATMAVQLVHLYTVSHHTEWHFPADILLRLIWVGCAMAGLWIAWKGRADDMVESRRSLRFWFVLAIGGFVLLVSIMGLITQDAAQPNYGFVFVNLCIPILTTILCAAMFSIRREDLFASTQPCLPPEPPVDDAAQDQLALRLESHMQSERPYRDETMTIAKLAGQLGEQEYRLRRLINGRLGHRNFAAFLNSYRLDEVKTALVDPQQREVPILTMALDAGFGSLGPFNRAFREAEGMTPTNYRAQHAC